MPDIKLGDGGYNLIILCLYPQEAYRMLGGFPGDNESIRAISLVNHNYNNPRGFGTGEKTKYGKISNCFVSPKQHMGWALFSREKSMVKSFSRK